MVLVLQVKKVKSKTILNKKLHKLKLNFITFSLLLKLLSQV